MVVLCLPADQKIGPGDTFIAERLLELRRQKLVGGHQVRCGQPGHDRVAPDGGQPVRRLDGLAGQRLRPRVGRRRGQRRRVGPRARLIAARGPRLFGDEITDQPERVVVAELIRESALERLRDELPHSVAVDIDEMGMREGRRLMTLDGHLCGHLRRTVKPETHRAGAPRRTTQAIGAQARAKIEALLGTRVYLDLHVKIAKDWQNSPGNCGAWGSEPGAWLVACSAVVGVGLSRAPARLLVPQPLELGTGLELGTQVGRCGFQIADVCQAEAVGWGSEMSNG